MQIAHTHSHLHGESYLFVRRPQLYAEIKSMIASVRSSTLGCKLGRAKTTSRKSLCRLRALNTKFNRLFRARRWRARRCQCYVTDTKELPPKIINLPLERQREVLHVGGVHEPMKAHRELRFVKGRVAVEPRFSACDFEACDLLVDHQLFYSGGVIDVGIVILPTQGMLNEAWGGRAMSLKVASFEREVRNLLRHGRNDPPVPLVFLGVKH